MIKETTGGIKTLPPPSFLSKINYSNNINIKIRDLRRLKLCQPILN
jgi:hypothetical protein